MVVTFEAGSKFSSYASIPIASDNIQELDETFRATFELPDGYKKMEKADPRDVEITIEDKNQGLYIIGRCVTIYKYIDRKSGNGNYIFRNENTPSTGVLKR